MDPIVIATGNPHKVDELRTIFARVEIPVLGLRDLPGHGSLVEPTESGSTFAENAAIKARAYAAQTGRLCLADDSGLEIDALHGRPGVISSHYCTDGRDGGMARGERDRRNNERVLRELHGVPPPRRGARFVCVMCVAGAGGDPCRIIFSARGIFEGRIGLSGDVPRGENGFGYDPLFLVAPDFARTSAELPPAEKNRLSHRARAAERVAEWLRHNAARLVAG